MRPILFAALLAACQTQAPTDRVPGAIAPEGEVVFTINGDIQVHDNMYQAVLTRIPPEQRARMEEAPGGLKRLEDQMAMSQILYKRAVESGLTKEKDVTVGLAMAERDFLAAMYVQREGEKAVTDEAIAKAYEERKVNYARPQVKGRMILVKEESAATDVKAKLEGGAKFEDLVTEFSVDPGTKDKGGDMGWLEARRMDPALSDAAFAAEKGAVIGPIQTRFGFSIYEVQDKRDSVPLEDAREELSGTVRQAAIQEMLQTLQSELKVLRPGEDPNQAVDNSVPGIRANPTPIRRPPPSGAPNHPGATAVRPMSAAPAGTAATPAPAPAPAPAPH